MLILQSESYDAIKLKYRETLSLDEDILQFYTLQANRAAQPSTALFRILPSSLLEYTFWVGDFMCRVVFINTGKHCTQDY